MPEQKKKNETDKPASPRAQARWIWVLPVLLFLAISTWLVSWARGNQAQLEQQVKVRQELNSHLGLPRDYPIDVVPLYDGVSVLETTREDAKSSDGEPMDKWFIHAQIEASRKPIFEYYHNLMLARGMAQTQFISLPASDGSGASYAVNYADEEFIVEFTIEKTSKDPMTQLKITVYRVR